MKTTYITFSSQQLGGLVVEQHREGFGTRRAVVRADGTATVWFKADGRDRFLISRNGKGRAATEARDLFAAARQARA